MLQNQEKAIENHGKTRFFEVSGAEMGNWTFRFNSITLKEVLFQFEIVIMSLYLWRVNNSIKSDYPPPAGVPLIPIFALHMEFFKPHMTFRQNLARS